MHPDLLNILAHQDQPIDNEQLVAYLTGRLNAEDSHKLERQLAEAGFDSDAMEGLMQMSDKKKLGSMLQELNLFLNEKLKKPKTRQKRRAIISLPVLLVVTAILITVMILLWYFVYYLGKGN